MRDGESQQARAPVLEWLSSEALRESVRRIHGREEFPRLDGAAGDAPPRHGVPHGQPARRLVRALAVRAVEDGLRVEVERRRLGRTGRWAISGL